MSLTKEQLERYARNIIVTEIGEKGQEKLLKSRILVVGAGGLGSPACFYLAAAGVGTIGIVDGDVVDITNLQRQILHSTEELGRPKVISARETLRELNPDVNVEVYQERLSPANAPDILKKYDFVIDATDSFASKFFVADACHFAKKPYVHSAVIRFDGELLTVIPGKTTCYRCVFNEPPAPGLTVPPAKAGVLGVSPGIFGTIQASEAIKYVLGAGELMTDRLLVYDGLSGRFRDVKVARNPDCPLCGKNPLIKELKLYEA